MLKIIFQNKMFRWQLFFNLHPSAQGKIYNRFVGGIVAITLLFLILLLCMFNLSANNSNYGFIENKGQISDQNYQPNSAVKYLYSGKNLRVHIRKQGFSYELFRIIQNSEIDKIMASSSPDLKNLRELKLQSKTETHRIDVELPGSNPDAEIIAEGAFADYLNYYTPATVPNGALHVRHFRKITYRDIYPLVDLVFEINKNNGEVKYDFIVKPGGNIKDIRLLYKGSGEILFTGNQITVQTSISPLTETIPDSYQERGERKFPVNVFYQKIRENEFGFTTKKYDRSLPLVIDPVPNIAWGTYYGGSLNDYGMGAAIDINRNALASGDAQSPAIFASAGTFQTTYSGAGDIFIAKFDTTGNRLWATYYGGTGWDASTCITTDSSGNVFVTGWVTGPAVFSTPGAHQMNFGGSPWDAVIAKFDPNGARIWSTYYGGAGDDEGWGIVTDASGNVLVAGNTQSTSNIASPGAHQGVYGGGPNDAFIAKFNPGGTLLWGTYYGGTGNETYYYRSGLVVDNKGNVFNTSWTNSPNGANVIATAGAHQTTLNGLKDAFIVKFNSNGTRLWSTYYGGVGDDGAYGAVTDANGNVIVVGETYSPANIASVGAYQTTLNGTTDAFIAKFDTAGSFQWGSYFGGDGVDRAFAVEYNCDNLIFFGLTGSSSGITTANTHQPTYSGGANDGFITLFSPKGDSVVWSTYYGGNNDEYAYFNVVGMASNNFNDVAIVGTTNSTNNIAYGNSYQSTLNTVYDAFVARFKGTMIQVVVSDTTICAGNTATLTAAGGTNYLWNTGDTTSIITVNPVSTAIYTITVSNGFCSASANITVSVTNSVTPNISGNKSICSGDSTTLTASGGTNYLWSTGDTTSVVTVDPAVNKSYFVTVTDSIGCSAKDTISITVANDSNATITSTLVYCVNGSPVILTAVSGGGVWTGNGITNTGTGAFNPEVAGTGSHPIIYTISGSCGDADTVTIAVKSAPAVSLGSDTGFCTGNNLILNAGNAGSTFLWNDSSTAQALTAGSAGQYFVVVTNTNGCSSGDTIQILVSANPVANAGNDVTILSGESVSLNGMGGGTYQWSPSVGLSCSNCAGPLANPIQTTTYVLTVTDTKGCTGTDTVTVTIDLREVKYVPNMFSPNDDGKNDKLFFYGTGIKWFNFVIYDRWGLQMIEIKDLADGWDGTFRGEALNSAVFVYFLKGEFISGNQFEEKGNISLLR